MVRLNGLVTLISTVLLLFTETSDNKTKIKQLLAADPLGIIIDFLSHQEQRSVRFINHRFNYYYNKAHSDIKKNMFRIAIHAKEIIIDGIINNESINELKAIHQAIKYKEYYLKKWPIIIANCLEKKMANNASSSNKTWMHNIVLFMAALNIKLLNDSSCLLFQSANNIAGSLVMESHIIFEALFFGKPKYLDFHLFLYETMWIYLSSRNTSFNLPPHESIFYLDVNSELYERQILNLNTLHDEYGLIVWDPSILSPGWSSDNFYRYVNEYMVFCNLWNKFIITERDLEFLWYLQVRFIVKLLQSSKWAESDYRNYGDDRVMFDYLEFVIQQSINYLWRNRYWDTLDQILFALHMNKALPLLQDNNYLMTLCTASNTTETFIGIFLRLYDYKHSLDFNAFTAVVKSIYFWFLENDRAESMTQIAALYNHLSELGVTSVLVEFLDDPMLDFIIGNHSKSEYLEAVQHARVQRF